MDILKEKNKELFYYLNNIGFDLKSKILGKNVCFVLTHVSQCFCEYYCRYDDLCLMADSDKDKPYCPLKELIL